MPHNCARLICCVMLASSFVFVSSPQAQSKRALQIEDYYRVKTVGGTRIAPDGAWVLFTVATRVEDDPAAKRANASTTHTYVVTTDGTAKPRLVQHEGKDVAGAQWTDDSWIQYRVGTQTFKIAPQGGTPVPVQRAAAAGREGSERDPDAPVPGGRGGSPAVPSADGRWIAETREKPRPRSAPAYASEFEKRHYERFQGATFDWKDFQRDGAPFPAPDPTAASALQLLVRPAGGGEPKVLVDLDMRPANIAWHPDGKTLAFTADATFRDALKYAKPDLWTVTTDGTLTQLTKDGYTYSDVDYSPDGKYLSYERGFGTDMIISQKLNHGGSTDLFVRPVAGGEPINLTAKWDLEPGGDTRWSPDSKHLYFTAGSGGETHLFRVSAPAGQVEQVTRGARRIGNLTFDRAMTKIAYTVGLRETAPDVYVANLDGSNERRLSDVHAETAAEIAFSRSQRLQWASKDGTKIEGFLTFPHDYDPKKGPYPLIVTSHGGPHSAVGYAHSFKDQFFAANGYFLLDTNFRSSTGYGDAFKWATWGAWGDKDGEDVTSGLDYVLKNYPVDPRRVGHIGHSYGGFLSNWLVTHTPTRSLPPSRARESATGSVTTAPRTSIEPRRPSSSARRGTRLRESG